MGGLSAIHWLAFGAVALLVFGTKFKFSDLMGDIAKGLSSFKKEMEDDGITKE